MWLGVPVAAAEILFQEDFEDGNLGSRGWYDMFSWGMELFINTPESRRGRSSLEVRYRVDGAALDAG